MLTTLSNLADIKLGYLPRVAMPENLQGTTRLLLIADINTDGSIKFDSAMRTDLDAKDLERFSAQQNDILIPNRGARQNAVLITNTIQSTIISAHFFILRVTSDNILPEYLVWFLNQKSAQTHISRNKAGTSIQLLSKRDLDELEVIVPPLNVQEKIAKLDQLNRHYQEIANSLRQKMDTFIAQTLLQSISKKLPNRSPHGQ